MAVASKGHVVSIIGAWRWHRKGMVIAPNAKMGVPVVHRVAVRIQHRGLQSKHKLSAVYIFNWLGFEACFGWNVPPKVLGSARKNTFLRPDAAPF